jgi:hypothetical protein
MNKEELKEVIRQEVTAFMQGTLDFVQVACPDGHYKTLRSKILRIGNDCMRNLSKYVEDINE